MGFTSTGHTATTGAIQTGPIDDHSTKDNSLSFTIGQVGQVFVSPNLHEPEVQFPTQLSSPPLPPQGPFDVLSQVRALQQPVKRRQVPGYSSSSREDTIPAIREDIDPPILGPRLFEASISPTTTAETNWSTHSPGALTPTNPNTPPPDPIPRFQGYLENASNLLYCIVKWHGMIIKRLSISNQPLSKFVSEIKTQSFIVNANQQIFLPDLEGLCYGAYTSSIKVDELLESIIKALDGVEHKLKEFHQELIKKTNPRQLTKRRIQKHPVSKARQRRLKQSQPQFISNRNGPRSKNVKKKLKNCNQRALPSAFLDSLDKRLNCLKFITDELSHFNSLGSEFSQSLASVSCDGSHKEALEKYATSRDTTFLLYRQLSEVCPEHHQHQVYFNLRVDESNHQSCCDMRFHIGFVDGNNDSRIVWYLASATPLEKDSARTLTKSMRKKPTKSRGVTQRPPLARNVRSSVGAPSRPAIDPRRTRSEGGVRKVLRDNRRERRTHHPAVLDEIRLLISSRSTGPQPGTATHEREVIRAGGYCLGNLQQHTGVWAADLPSLGIPATAARLKPNSLFYPPKDRVPCGQPIPLSQWINNDPTVSSMPIHPSLKSTALKLVQVQVARLIVESVLRFPSSVWSQKPLTSKHVMVLEHTNLSLEPHLGVNLIRKGDGEDYEQTTMQMAQRLDFSATLQPQLYSDLMLRLAIILLELALLEPISLREGPTGEIDRDDWSSRKSSVRDKGSGLKDILGDKYAKAFEHCFAMSDANSSNFSQDIQLKFYQHVILGLTKAEQTFIKSLEQRRIQVDSLRITRA